MPILIQCVGFVGSVFMLLSYQQKTQKKIMLLQIFAISFFCLHFYLLDRDIGFFLNLAGVVRAAVYYNRDKKWAKSKLWILAFSAVYIIICVDKWEGWISILPMLAMILSSISFYIINAKYVRLLTFPCSPLWMTYNIISGSIAGTVTEIIVMISILYAIYKFDIKKKKIDSAV